MGRAELGNILLLLSLLQAALGTHQGLVYNPHASHPRPTLTPGPHSCPQSWPPSPEAAWLSPHCRRSKRAAAGSLGLLRHPLQPEQRTGTAPPTHLYSDDASWAAIGTSLAKMSGPVTAESVGFTGKGFTKGAPGTETNCGDQVHANLQSASVLPSLYPTLTLSLPSAQTFHRLQGVQCRDGLVVDEVVVLLSRVVPGGPEKEE